MNQDFDNESDAMSRRGCRERRRMKEKRDLILDGASESDLFSHPLEYAWSFWVNDSTKDWKKALSHVCDFSTIEEFWALFFNLCGPSDSRRLNFNVFKKGVRPEWEDEANGKAGRWNITTLLPEGELCDLVWEELCLLLIGGKTLGSLTANVNGVYLSRKSSCIRASVWMNTKNKREVLAIGRKIQETLLDHVGQHFQLEFVLHKAQKNTRKILFRIE
ncbi:eukaryotic translation initiation factor 4E isoform X2 [Galendromus occidentalis]|uniref:Eukaryotic translation initiation factor 4E isoform X2 n=1 Tax=Galendromus occidentalis TaxID=34638 RepID=A0AAJ6VYX9_9ACAR|nr:eukaryotic translation initiation factor 4E isoform X2 [Galendromus occidentalis]